MKLLKTGISGLDEFLQGGLPPRVVLLPGPPGSGNEVFARQIAYTRAKQSGVTYFTVNTTFDFVKEDMAAYGWDISPLEEAGNWKFKNLTPTSSMVNDVIEEMKQHRSVVIDSLSELLITSKIKETVNLLTNMSSQNRECDQFHLLLLTEGMQDQKVETTMKHFAEGVIVFNIAWSSDSAVRHIMIGKMRGTLIPARRLPYTIGRKGFVIETATRIT
jgi:KaiC/GvpD/RAD55 family RecA-like ATPase